jgi:tetratricopeptide (TPR) repeat protein
MWFDGGAGLDPLSVDASRAHDALVGARIGPFEVEALLGRGGAAEVWRATHVPLARRVAGGESGRGGASVAIKVVTAQHAREPRLIETLETEARAAARLDHPAIARVLDHGIVSPDAEALSDGRFAAGSPYLVMELASGGTLEAVPRPFAWDDLVRTLLVLLDALAHAHARGVIHRDLKLANVLLAAEGDLRPGLKLTDFGIAHALGGELSPEHQAETAHGGTPAYMAPEQIMGEWRDYGPWTDLYALGCLAFALANGELPFRGAHPAATAYMHLEQPPPALGPDAPRVAGFEDWLHRLLAKRPFARFQRAADAAWALRAIDDAHRGQRGGRSTVGAPVDAAALAERLVRESRPPIVPEHDPALSPVPAGTATPSWAAGVARRDGPPARTRLRPEQTDAPLIDASARPLFDAWRVPEPEAVTQHAPTADMVTRLEGCLDALTALTLPWIERGDDDGGAAPAPPADLVRAAASREEGSRPDARSPLLAPPLPRVWHVAERDDGDLVTAAAAGLGLFGRRVPPLVGRTAERDRLWAVLRDARERPRPRCVVIESPPGYGKSRLAAWLAERADEVGSAEVVRVLHSPAPSPHDGIEAALVRHLGLVGLSRGDAARRLERVVEQRLGDAELARGLEAALLPTADASTRGEERAARGLPARHGVLLSYLERLAELRPVIVWLEDVEWGHAALRLVEAALSSPGLERAIVFVATHRVDAEAADAGAEAALARLLARRDVDRVRLGPLSPEAHRALVGELLRLEPELAERVASRTEGNPLFATELLSDWVARGVLVPGPRGLMLAPGEEPGVPASVRELWVSRLDHVLERHGEDARTALELLAVLGNEVELQEWVALAALVGAATSERLVTPLVDARLVERTPRGLRFLHGMLRETIEQGFRGTPRFAHFHAACAAMLEAHGGDDAAERVGRHWLLGRRPERALAPLLVGARERLARGDVHVALELVALRDAAIERLGPTRAEGAGRVAGWLVEIEARLTQGDSEAAARALARAEAVAAREDERIALAVVHGELAYADGRYDEAARVLASAERGAPTEGLRARAQLGLGDVAYRRGRLAEAERHYAAALAGVERAGLAGRRLVGEHLRALWGLGYVALWRRALPEAAAHFERQRALAARFARRLDEARALSALGEVARLSGQLTPAERAYRESLGVHRALRSGEAEVAELNLALVLLARGELDRGERITSRVLAALEARGRLGQLYVAALAQLALVAAARGEGARFEAQLADVERRAREMRLLDGDLAEILRLAATHAARTLDDAAAERVVRLAARFEPRIDASADAHDPDHAAVGLDRGVSTRDGRVVERHLHVSGAPEADDAP